MNDLERSAMEQALEALEAMTQHFGFARLGSSSLADTMKRGDAHVAITALRAALEAPVQEPVAIVGTQVDTWKGYGAHWSPPGPPIKTVHMLRELPEGTPLYAAPPHRSTASATYSDVVSDGGMDTR